jgi:ribonuclease-3
VPEKAAREERETTELEALEATLGHHFAQRALLVQALTHSSLRHEKYTLPRQHAGQKARQVANSAETETQAGAKTLQKARGGMAADGPKDESLADNERLEFLGDAIVGLLVAESLYRRFPDLSEGELTRLRAALVSRKHLGEVGEKLGLGRWLRMGREAERNGGRAKGVLLANCVEALAAALYLDAPEPEAGRKAGGGAGSKKQDLRTTEEDGREGCSEAAKPHAGGAGLAAAAAFVESAIMGRTAARLHRELRANEAIGDYKSALQELMQARGEGQPEYTVKAATGPDHHKRFVVQVLSAGEAGRALAQGSGTTKKNAEQAAARKALERLRAASAGGESSAVQDTALEASEAKRPARETRLSAARVTTPVTKAKLQPGREPVSTV